jgi:hypothetical protein
MCGEYKGEIAELMNQKELWGAMDMGMLWLISVMDSLGFKFLKFALVPENDKYPAS